MLHLEGERSEIRCYKHRLHVYGQIHPPAGHLIFALPLRFWKISKQNCLQRRKRLLHWLIWFIGLFLCVHIHWILWLCPVYYFFVYFTMDTFTGQWACLRFIGLFLRVHIHWRFPPPTGAACYFNLTWLLAAKEAFALKCRSSVCLFHFINPCLQWDPATKSYIAKHRGKGSIQKKKKKKWDGSGAHPSSQKFSPFSFLHYIHYKICIFMGWKALPTPQL